MSEADIAAIASQVERTLEGLAIARRRFKGNGDDIFERLFAHAAARVPAWQELCWRGSRSDSLRSLPVLDREMVASDPERFIARGEEPEVVQKTTSGFTGPALTIAYDLCAQYFLNTWLYAKVLDFFPAISNTLRPGAVSIGLVTNKPTRESESVLLPMLGATVWRRFQLRENMMLQALGIANPPVIYGKPMYVRELMDLVSDTDRRLSPVCILTSGERLYDDDRAAIGPAFRVPLVDAFATAECGIVAVSYPDETKLRVYSDLVFVEVLRSTGEISDHGFGELLVTSAFNWLNPFIRYRTGDVGFVRKLKSGKQLLESVRRRTERSTLGPSAVATRDIEDEMLRYGIWDYRLRVVNGCGFLIWSSQRPTAKCSSEFPVAVAKILKIKCCRARRISWVTAPGMKRLRYPD